MARLALILVSNKDLISSFYRSDKVMDAKSIDYYWDISKKIYLFVKKIIND